MAALLGVGGVLPGMLPLSSASPTFSPPQKCWDSGTGTVTPGGFRPARLQIRFFQRREHGEGAGKAKTSYLWNRGTVEASVALRQLGGIALSSLFVKSVWVASLAWEGGPDSLLSPQWEEDEFEIPCLASGSKVRASYTWGLLLGCWGGSMRDRSCQVFLWGAASGFAQLGVD